MRKSTLFCIFAMMAGGLSSCNEIDKKSHITSQYVDYQRGSNQFVVIAIQKAGMNQKDAKKLAMKRCAELAEENGFRYFRLEKEYKTVILHTDPTEDVYRFPGNLYQEDIQEQGFNRDRILENQGMGPQKYPCYRIEIVCEKSFTPGSYDACEYTGCKKNK